MKAKLRWISVEAMKAYVRPGLGILVYVGIITIPPLAIRADGLIIFPAGLLKSVAGAPMALLTLACLVVRVHAICQTFH